MAATISRHDIMVILTAVIQMARQDKNLEQREKELIQRLIQLASVSQSELKAMQEQVKVGVEALLDTLESPLAKKAFVLAIATIAMADSTVDAKEQSMIDRMSDKLGVGRIKLDTTQYVIYEAKVFELVGSSFG